MKIFNRFIIREDSIGKIIHLLKNNGKKPILSYLNENSKFHFKTFNNLKKYLSIYHNNYFSIKLSGLNIENDYYLTEQYIKELIEIGIENNSKIFIDAEYNKIQDKIYNLSDNLMKEYNKNEVNVFKTYPCNRIDMLNTFFNDLSNKNDYYLGVNLVKRVSYIEDYEQFRDVLIKDKIEISNNYMRSTIDFMKKCDDNDKLMVSTNNEDIIFTNKNYERKFYLNNIEYSQLYDRDNINNRYFYGNADYIYLPFGKLINCYPYLVRRINEDKSIIF